MSKDQTLGAVVFVVRLIGIVIYGYLIFFWDPILVPGGYGFPGGARGLGDTRMDRLHPVHHPPPQPIEQIEKELQEEAGKAGGLGAASSRQTTQK